MEDYTRGEQEFLLKTARRVLTEYLSNGTRQQPQTVNQNLWEKRGVFVTILKNGKLRGCIGHLEMDQSLIASVSEMSIAVAHDPRFPPLEFSELEDIEIEISILTEKIKTSFEEIKSGDGVLLVSGDKTATFLPQVWQDLKNKKEFMASLCQKADLDNECYLDASTEFYVYQALVFREDTND
ncbi:MAG: AmmeMemoRadiSam system protein A [bacterium]